MEIACVIDSRLAAPSRPGRSGGSRPGRDSLPDPLEAAERTETAVRALEAIGAAVESERAGEVFFAVDGLRGLHGGDGAGVLTTAWKALEAAGFRQAAMGKANGTGAPIGRAGAGGERGGEGRRARPRKGGARGGGRGGRGGGRARGGGGCPPPGSCFPPRRPASPRS